MKKLFVLGAAVVAFASCTNDQVLDSVQPVQNAIGFYAHTNKATKAVTETTGADLTKFHVFGYYDVTAPSSTTTKVFDNVAVTKVTENDKEEWKYDGETQFWTKNMYHFAAYADQNTPTQLSKDEVSFVDETLTFTDYTVVDAKDLVADIQHPDNRNYGAYEKKVGFSFKHLLSKIKFVVRNTSADYKMRIKSPLTISSIKQTGTCVVTSDAINWDPTEDANLRVITAGSVNDIFAKLDEDTEDDIKTSRYHFVMPQQDLAAVKFSITVEFLDDNNQVVKEKTVSGNLNPTDDLEWDPGYVYVYNISLPTSALPIEFDVTGVDGWANYGSTIELNPDDKNAQESAGE